MLTGQATADATKTYADNRWRENPRISPDSWRLIEGITVAKIGLGTYRMGNHPQHAEALEAALLGGLNLIDTASNYQDGAAETLIGKTLAKLVLAKKLSRDEVMLVTKAGYIQGQTLARLAGNPYPDTDVLADNLAHCLHPDFLADQLAQSQTRMGVEHIDIFLLHNPEYALQAAQQNGVPLDEARAAFYSRITAAFTFLEHACKDGKIGYYGVSSNTIGDAPDSPVAVNLATLAACADAAAQAAWGRRKRSQFRVLQMPLNLLETNAVFVPNTEAVSFSGTETVSALELAARRNMTVLTNRPLNAFSPQGHALRLSAPQQHDADAILAALTAAENALEAHWGGWPHDDDGTPALRFGQYGKPLLDSLHGRIHADQVAQTMVRPTAASLAPLAANTLLWQPYSAAIDDFVALMNAHAAAFEAPALAALQSHFHTHTGQTAPLQQLAVNALTSLPGVTCALLGARHPLYVADALKTLEMADFADPAPLFDGNPA